MTKDFDIKKPKVQNTMEFNRIIEVVTEEESKTNESVFDDKNKTVATVSTQENKEKQFNDDSHHS